MASVTNNFNRIQDTTNLTTSLGNLDSGDTEQPYSYLDWRLRAGIVKPDQLFNAYNEYIRNWYNKRNITRSVPTTHILKQDYITLLKQLVLTFQTDAERSFLQNIDYNNDIDLAISIPIFARQLKQISIYLAEKRESVKSTKLKYSMAGTQQAIEKVLYQHLLTAFTQKKYATQVYDPEFYASLPQLSSVNNLLTVQIDELYDESNYFDSDPTVPVSSYTGVNDFEFVNSLLNSALVAQLADTRNYDVSSTDIQTKYLGTTHYQVSADNAGNITETVSIVPVTPYAHSTNRYYGTVASIPNSNSIKTYGEIGGFFTFKNLGVTTFLAATKSYEYNIEAMVPGIVYNIPDPLFINHGRSLTLKDQIGITIHQTNTDWVKAKGTNNYQEGFLVGARHTQKFIPYQSTYETMGVDTQGITRTSDRFDFWIGDFSDIWSDQITYPLTWRGEYNIDERAALLQITSKKLHNWSTDIFGNHYGIYKDYNASLSAIGIYEKRDMVGEVWVRTANSTVNTAPVILTNIFEKYATINNTIYNKLINNQIHNIDVIKDTIILEIDGYILIEHISYDYDTDQITTGAGGGNIIVIPSSVVPSSPPPLAF